MFTGLVEEIGTIVSIKRGVKSSRLTIAARDVLEEIKLGDSIATNGICLTVTSFNSNSFTVDVMAETLRVSNLGKLKSSDKVNLERAMRLTDRVGGHMVSGHIDGLGTIKNFYREDNATVVEVESEKSLLKYVIYKGSIAIDGVSLTVFYVDETTFKVSIIPHTGHETTLLEKNIGESVNLECDMIGKYVEKLLNFKNTKDKRERHTEDLSVKFLSENGFL